MYVFNIMIQTFFELQTLNPQAFHRCIYLIVHVFSILTCNKFHNQQIWSIFLYTALLYKSWADIYKFFLLWMNNLPSEWVHCSLKKLNIPTKTLQNVHSKYKMIRTIYTYLQKSLNILLFCLLKFQTIYFQLIEPTIIYVWKTFLDYSPH